jgi:hypothetical protein
LHRSTDAKHFLVKNFINNTSFFEWDQATHASYFRKFKDAIEITIPKLNEMAYEQVVLASVPFLASGPTSCAAAISPIIRSSCAAMSGTGSAMSGASTTASISTKS